MPHFSDGRCTQLNPKERKKKKKKIDIANGHCFCLVLNINILQKRSVFLGNRDLLSGFNCGAKSCIMQSLISNKYKLYSRYK